MTQSGRSNFKLLLLWLLNAYDGLVTFYFLRAGEIPVPGGGFVKAEEQNPLMDWAFGEGVFLHLKFWGMTLLIFFIWHLYDKYPDTNTRLLYVPLVPYTLLAMWHAFNMMTIL